jgi:hypothetical protein
MSLLLLFLDFPFRRRVVGSCSKKAILAPVVLRLGEMNDIVGPTNLVVRFRSNLRSRKMCNDSFSAVTTMIRLSTWLSERLPVYCLRWVGRCLSVQRNGVPSIKGRSSVHHHGRSRCFKIEDRPASTTRYDLCSEGPACRAGRPYRTHTTSSTSPSDDPTTSNSSNACQQPRLRQVVIDWQAPPPITTPLIVKI